MPGDLAGIVPGVTAMDFSRFPVELHHQIVTAMDPEDILVFRKTSKYFHALTHDPRLWTAVYCRMRQTHPLSCSEEEFAALTSSQSERLLVRASKTTKMFQTFRKHPQNRIFPTGQTRKIGPLVALAFLSERFLMSVDDMTMVYVWDLSKLLASSADAPAFPSARLTLVGWKFLTYSMSNDHSMLYIALSTAARTHIFSLSLLSTTSDADDDPELSFRDVTYIDTHSSRVSSIDADSCLVLLNSLDATSIEVVNWRTENQSRIPLLQEPHSLRNYVLWLRICGPYMLCFRRWSLEAYPLPLELSNPERATESGAPLSVLQHAMPNMTLTATIRLSHVCCHRTRGSGDTTITRYTLCALAKDYQVGTLYYQIRIQTTPVPSLSIQLLGLERTHADGRVSAYDLGMMGQRGAWVLAPNRSGVRHVVAFTRRLPPHLIDAIDPVMGDSSILGLDVPPEIAPRFETSVVSTVTSWDPNDDVTKCAVSEFTGRIALGSRTGMITVI